jgi:hypothetical protein
MMDSIGRGDLVEITDSPGLLDRHGSFLKYCGMVGLVVDAGTGGDCWVVQLDDGNEVEVPEACLTKEE